MFKLLMTLFRARTAAAAEALADQEAAGLLVQHIRDATAEIRVAKRALALAIVQDEGEGKRAHDITARIGDLEARAVEALRGGRDDLAGDAAQAIAGLEAERAAIEATRRLAGKDIAAFKAAIRDTGFRLADLERGRRIASAAEALARLRSRAAGPGTGSALADAEATLARMHAKQIEAADVHATLAALDVDTSPDAIAVRLETEGFGPRRADATDAVIARLRLKALAGDQPGSPPSPTPLLPFVTADRY